MAKRMRETNLHQRYNNPRLNARQRRAQKRNKEIQERNETFVQDTDKNKKQLHATVRSLIVSDWSIKGNKHTFFFCLCAVGLPIDLQVIFIYL